GDPGVRAGLLGFVATVLLGHGFGRERGATEGEGGGQGGSGNQGGALDRIACRHVVLLIVGCLPWRQGTDSHTRPVPVRRIDWKQRVAQWVGALPVHTA